MNGGFLPVSRKEMKERGWDQVDFVYISGDAYVDHPSFGHAIITRLLESRGYRVGIIAQPDWKTPDSVTVFGEPRLGFLVSAGNMDSMVNHYSVSKKRRKTDAYTPGGVMGKRPDYEERMVQILRMMIAESTARFEQLPCLVDVDILRNILYDGVWNHYNKIQMKKREEKNDDKKSI